VRHVFFFFAKQRSILITRHGNFLRCPHWDLHSSPAVIETTLRRYLTFTRTIYRFSLSHTRTLWGNSLCHSKLYYLFVYLEYPNIRVSEKERREGSGPTIIEVNAVLCLASVPHIWANVIGKQYGVSHNVSVLSPNPLLFHYRVSFSDELNLNRFVSCGAGSGAAAGDCMEETPKCDDSSTTDSGAPLDDDNNIAASCLTPNHHDSPVRSEAMDVDRTDFISTFWRHRYRIKLDGRFYIHTDVTDIEHS